MQHAQFDIGPFMPFDASARLRRLSEEAAKISRALLTLSSADDSDQIERGEASPARTSAMLFPDVSQEAISAGEIRMLIRLRKLRESYFGSELFADPAWDILLDLFVASLEDKHISVSSLCIASAVPVTTALRLINAMTENGLLARSTDPSDGRRNHIALTPQSRESLVAYFRAARLVAVRD